MTINVSGPRLFGAAAVHRAARLYLEIGSSVFPAYTPANMIRAAEKYTGQPITKRGKAGLRIAADNLQAYLVSNGWQTEA